MASTIFTAATKDIFIIKFQTDRLYQFHQINKKKRPVGALSKFNNNFISSSGGRHRSLSIPFFAACEKPEYLQP